MVLNLCCADCNMVLNLCCAHSPMSAPVCVSSFLVVLAMRSFAFASRMDAKENSDDIASSAEWVHARRHASIIMTRRNLRIVFASNFETLARCPMPQANLGLQGGVGA